jgi:hypothetical protein
MMGWAITAKVLTKEILERGDIKLEPANMLRVVVDVDRREVWALHDLAHIQKAAEIAGVSEDELTTANAGHLIGGTISFGTLNGKPAATIGMRKTSLEKKAPPPEENIKAAEKIIYDYLYRSEFSFERIKVRDGF